MTAITLQPALAEEVRRTAEDIGVDASALVNEAVEEYIAHLRRERLQAEIVAFERMHEELKARYLGYFVAIHNGEVVDSDRDFGTLFLRVRERLGSVPVLIRRVGAKPQTELHFRSPRME